MNAEERRIIYPDHNATTPTLGRKSSRPWPSACVGGRATRPVSTRAGSRARRILEDAREAIAAMLGADATASPPDRVIFTSGGTEANNLAVLGISQAAGSPGRPRPGHCQSAHHLRHRTFQCARARRITCWKKVGGLTPSVPPRKGSSAWIGWKVPLGPGDPAGFLRSWVTTKQECFSRSTKWHGFADPAASPCTPMPPCKWWGKSRSTFAVWELLP